MNDAKKTSSRRWTWLASLAALLLPALALWLLILDDAPPDLSGLGAPAVPRTDNAFFELATVGEALDAEHATISSVLMWAMEGEAFPLEQVARSLARHEEAIDRAVAACRSRRIQTPRGGDPDDASTLLHWLQLRARVRAEAGQGEAALEDVFVIFDGGVALRADALDTEAWLEGQSVTEAGGRALNDALARLNFSDARLALVDRRLAGLAAVEPGLARARLGDAQVALGVLEGSKGRAEAAEVQRALFPFAQDGLCALADTALWRLVYKPERTRRLVIERFRLEAAAIEDPGRTLPAIVEEVGGFDDLMSGNALGRAFLGGKVEHGDAAELRLTRSRPRVVHEALRVRVALSRFEGAEGRWPRALAELCPRYLKVIPRDVDGEPLRYSAADEVLYSVGEDGEDSFAVSQDPEEGDELIWSLKRARRP